jgi:glycosyltransferase involved in cell wall biosynthesis
MNILILCKRRPQNKDLLTRPYGRFYYLAKLLADRGHKVVILLLDYEKSQPLSVSKDNIQWKSTSMFPFPFLNYYLEAKSILNKNKIDWIFGFSDTYYGIMAEKLSKRHKTKCLVDAYDNYESYIPWLRPLHWAWRTSLRNANIVSAAGPQLAELFEQLGLKCKPLILPMSADPEFKPKDKADSRKALDLPRNKYLIGYCGGLYRNRGIELLFELIEHFKFDKDIEFIISGRLEENVPEPKDAKWLGYIDDEKVPDLLNSLDAMLVFNKRSKFGEFSYPVKIYEALNCGISIIAGNTENLKWILEDYPEMIAETGNIDSYIEKINSVKNKKFSFKQTSWEDSCDTLENAITNYS